MDIEKTLELSSSPDKVWALLLDPQIMGSCVPGMQSIEVISDTEYLANIHVKLAFISAKFKVRTLVTEKREPSYLRSESTGEDASVASSLKSVTELFLSELAPDRTELKVKVKVDVFGKLGSLGLNAMKTKSDRMWEEFGRNLSAKVNPQTPAPDQIPAEKQRAAPLDHGVAVAPPFAGASVALPPVSTAKVSWWQRLLRIGTPPVQTIRIEIQKDGARITIDWPVSDSAQCAEWLKQYLTGR